MAVFEINLSLYKQANNQPSTQTPYNENKSFCFTKAGATKNEEQNAEFAAAGSLTLGQTRGVGFHERNK